MKKIIMILLAVGLAMGFTRCDAPGNDKTVTVSGKIENPNSERVVISLSAFPEDIVIDTAYLDGDGTFSSTFILDECSPATIYDGKESTKCFFCPGDSLHLTLNTESFDESLVYSGAGADINNFLAAYYLRFSDNDNPEHINFIAIRDTAIDVFIELLSSENEKAGDFVKQQQLQYQFPPEFNSYMNTSLFFTDVVNSQYVFYSKNKDTTAEYLGMESQVMDKILMAGNYPDPDARSLQYRVWVRSTLPNTLSTMLRKEFTGDGYDREFYDSALYARLGQYLSPEGLQMYYYSRISNLAYSYNYERMEVLRPMVDQYVTDTAVLAMVEKKYAEVEQALNQTLPDDATLYNLDEEELLDLSFNDVLAKYRGNVIYLDFWASWCGPCKAEMPNSAALSKKLKDEDVTFLYVSTDRDAAAWESMIKILQLHGLHYRLGKNTRKPVFEEFGIRYIPHYVLFDKKGNIVQNNMTRPGDPKTEEMIRELL